MGTTSSTSPPTVIRSAMLITLRFPRSSALMLNLVVANTDGQEQDFETTLTAVELAGRLSLATGKPISPEAVVAYCCAWQAATETLAGLVKKLGKSGLAQMVRKRSADEALWAPATNSSVLKWLKCILESHFLSQSRLGSGDSIRDRGELHGDFDLVELCRSNFAHAYFLWLTTETERAAQKPTGSRTGRT